MSRVSDRLDISSQDLALLQESQNIEFVVEEDDQASGDETEDDEPAYLYVDELDNDTDRNESVVSNVTNSKIKASSMDYSTINGSSDENDYEMYECLDDVDITPKKSKKQNTSGKCLPKQNVYNGNSKGKKKNDASKDKDVTIIEQNNMTKEADKTKTSDLNKSQYQQKIVMPKILHVQGGIVSPTNDTQKAPNPPSINIMQNCPKFVPVVPKTVANSPIATSLGVQKFLPDQAVLHIVKALGLSVEDIEKHGGTVAISIPDNLIQNGVLDLTKMSSVVQNATPIKGQQSMLLGIPSKQNTPIPVQNDISTKGKKFVPILPKKKCYVEGCETYEDKDNVFFPVPQYKEMRKIWDICLNSINRRIEHLDRICTKHFHNSDIIVSMSKKGVHLYENVQLKLSAGAVPCVKFHSTCCVPGCDVKDPDIMYNFPAYNKTNTELWMYMIRNPSLKTLNIRELLRHRVCYKHFDVDCFSDDKELRRTAAPTKHLPVADYTLLAQTKSSAALLDFSTVQLRCAYKRCRDRNNSLKKVFQFPSDFDKCQDWLYLCDRLDLLCPTADATMTKLYYLKFGLCENHFDDRDFEDRRKLALTIYAVPKHFHGDTVIEDKIPSDPRTKTDKDDDGDLLETSRAQSKRILPYVCFYLGCNKRVNKRSSDQFFSFPKDPERRKLWLEACGYKNFGEVNVSYKICKLHFSNKMFDKNGKLWPNAVPNKSAQTIDGPNESLNSDKKVVDRKKLIDDFMNTDLPSQDDGYFDTLDAIVAKWTDKSKLEFLRCAIPKCSKVFTNETYIGNAQMFPDPVKEKELYDMWLKITGSPVLLAMTPEVLRQTYVVCNEHFDEDSLLDVETKLAANAVPTKKIPVVTQIESSKENVHLYQQKMTPSTSSAIPTRPRAPPIKSNKLNDGLQWKELESVDLADSKDKTMCLLEDSNIVFPGMGYYLVDYPRDPKKINKRPYGVYQYRPTKAYGLTDDIEFGEALNIHTAIVIDDDDAIEREVMQKILDKRLKIV